MSGQKYLVSLMIVLMQVYWLHAKSLRFERLLPTVDLPKVNTHSNSNKRAAELVTCVPSPSQIKSYNQLYGGTTPVNSFIGDTMHYSLKAKKIESVTTVEDNERIESGIYADQSRFTPAGMDLANKVVCARILQELDAGANSISNTALCGWDYYCDYNANRFPNYLFKARCKTSRCNGDCNRGNSNHNRCQSHGIHVNVLEMRGNCEKWVWGQELLPIACTCESDAVMNV